MIRVAFLLGGKEWLGGYNYLLNLCRALLKYQVDIMPVVFVADEIEGNMLTPFYELNIEIIQDSIFNKKKKRNILLQSLLFGKCNILENIFTLHEIDVVFESNIYIGWRTKFSVVHWIPDFQHRHLPHMFSKLSWLKREIGFQIITKSSRSIMLSSNDAKQDCIKFYNVDTERIHVVPFAVESPHIDMAYSIDCLKKYNIKQDFFYLPNQFWRHKNHSIVVDALEDICKNSEREILIISSGSSKDTRTSSYFFEIKKSIKEKELTSNFKLLGIIPYRDVIHLMYASCAVINPSFFEGWSTTVEEAKSLGKQLIVSNLNVHKEQLGKEASFFSPSSSVELVEKILMIDCHSTTQIIDNSKNVKYYAQLFENMIQEIK